MVYNELHIACIIDIKQRREGTFLAHFYEHTYNWKTTTLSNTKKKPLKNYHNSINIHVHKEGIVTALW